METANKSYYHVHVKKGVTVFYESDLIETDLSRAVFDPLKRGVPFNFVRTSTLNPRGDIDIKRKRG